MDIINKIEDFLADIYFKMPNELTNDYIKICEEITAFFEKYFMPYEDVMQQARDILEYLLTVMQTGDYIKMADALNYEIKPIINDALLLIERDKLDSK